MAIIIKRLPYTLALLFLGGVLVTALNPPNSLLALPYGSGTYGTCTYSTCGISMTTSGTVSLNLTPNASGTYTTQSDSVGVATGASTGYNLTLSDSDNNTSLSSGANNLPSTAGSPGTPSTLPVNTWGYRVDGISGFGAGPTTAQSSVSSSNYTFAGLPASNLTAHILKTTSSAASPADMTLVWYGVRADTSKPNGSYTDSVTYTATTNP